MSLSKLSTNYAEYNHWVNTRFIEWLSKHPAGLLEAEVPSSYSSILKTLNHIWGVEAYWYAVIAETTEYERRFNLDAWDIEEVIAGLLKRSELLAELVPTFSEQDLLKVITVESPWFTSVQPRYEYIQHTINHAAYHRGQIVTMGRVLGITDAPMTDYNYYNVFLQSK